jgi:ABC-type Fe3+-hydroxamate transport system substrate-binding protein
MTKKLFVLAAMALIFAACNNTTSDQSQAQELAVITCEEFSTSPDKFVGQEIMIEGTAVHVCKHGGKRMFIIGEDPDERIKVTTGDEIEAFDVELEGSDISVIGIVDELRVDEAYLTNWENELMADNPDSEMKIHGGEEGHEHGEEGNVEEEMEQINDLRAQLLESGEDHLSFYSIIATEYKEKK